MGSRQSGYIATGGHKLHYLRMGKGKRILLAFHGYNNSAELFTPFEKHLAEDYTILSFDLPHHGKSEAKEEKPFRVKELVTLVENVKEEYDVKQISLMGYSMGGRVCLKIVEEMPRSIDKVLLIASDGLVFNPFYFFVTRTLIGKSMFKSFLTKPQRYWPIVEWAKNNRWLDESRYKFAMSYMQTDYARNFLLRVWPAMCRIMPNNKKLRKIVKKHKIPVYIFMGYYDRVIPPAFARRFQKGLESVELHIVNKGHRAFDADTLPQMAKCLLS